MTSAVPPACLRAYAKGSLHPPQSLAEARRPQPSASCLRRYGVPVVATGVALLFHYEQIPENLSRKGCAPIRGGTT